MGGFLETEKIRQIEFKLRSNYLSDKAKVIGFYNDKPFSYCLPKEFAEENLFSEIRQKVLAHFKENLIIWHDENDGRPSNHLCDSQVCCINFLFPFSDKPHALAELLRQLYPIQEMLPIENGLFVTFEWIGKENYLGEKIPFMGVRSRGKYYTSADAAVMFIRTDGKKEIVLIEWKYTESYDGKPLKIAKSGTDRSEIYRPLFDKLDCPINKDILPSYDSLFFEPFYQLMRQQLLANEMEKAMEMGADIVSVLHISPRNNIDFSRITSPELVKLGDSPTNVWSRLVKGNNKFITTFTETLFGRFSVEFFPELKEWSEYLHMRYGWVWEQNG